MRITLWLILLVVLHTRVAAQAPQLLSARREIVITLQADPPTATPLFGPVMEKGWSPDWHPRFLYRTGPEDQPTFAVFETGSADTPTTWVLTTYDVPGGHLEYVNIRAGHMITVLDIRCSAGEKGTTTARIAYTRTALSPEANSQVEHFAQEFPSQAPHWEQALNSYIQRTHGTPK